MERRDVPFWSWEFDEGAQRPFHTVVKIVWSGDIFVEKFHGVFKIGLN